MRETTSFSMSTYVLYAPVNGSIAEAIQRVEDKNQGS